MSREGFVPLEEYEAFRRISNPNDEGFIPLEEYDRPGFIETTRDVVSGRPARSSLPINIGAEIAANLPTEIGATTGIMRGLMGASPAVRGGVTGVARGLPAGPAAAVAYGAAGGLAGALAEQSLARGIQSGSPTLFGNPFLQGGGPQSVQDALYTVAGGMGFPLVLGALGRMFRRRTPGEELLSAQGLSQTPSTMTPEQRAAYNERAELSEEFDVPYTYGALTGDRSFMANREAIMRALPGSADPMTDFLVGQQGAVQRAGIRTATDIAPITPYEGYLRAADAARDTITSMVERRQRTARKMYADIWATKPTMSAQGFVDDLERASVNEEAGLKAIYERAIRDVKKNTAEDGSIPVETLHNIQSRYNANAAEATNSQKKRVNTVVGQSIKGVLDERVPGYTAVSNFYRDASQQIDRIREATKIGKIEKVNRVDVANKVKNWFTGPDVYPEEIRNIKQIWREELDPLKYTEAMKGLQSAFLRNAIERIDITQSGESIPNIAGKIAQALGGDPLMPGGIRKAQIVDELYTPAQRQKLNRLLRVLQDTSQILSIKSPTQPRLVAEEMQRTASEDVLRELGQVATEAATSGGMNVLDWVLRSPGRLKRVITRERQKEMQANELYAHALNEGTTATIQHFEKLERAVRRARELPGDAAQNELMTALGTFFGATVPQVNTPSAL